MNQLIKRVMCIVVGVAAAASVMLSYGQKMDLNKCRELIEASQTSEYLLPQQYDEVIAQCRILSNRFLKATDEIKQLPTVAERKEAAESFNAQYMEEYHVYAPMIRILKAALENRDAKKLLGRLNFAEAEHLINDDRYINSMFTIFRSSYEYR